MTESFGGDPLERAGKAPVFFSDPAIDRLFNMVMVLAEELSVARERVDTLERLLVENKLLAPDAVDSYTPDEAGRKRRSDAQQDLVARLLAGIEGEMSGMNASTGGDQG
ncbi:MAG: hypothetical protein QNJ40_07135 [Xanthomonadales bacterium]|nr:hypothetical protein [Xanthomonadales bacterium]